MRANSASPRGQVFVLADGMGGHMGGSVASKMAVTGFEKHFLSQRQPSIRAALSEATRLVNAEIFAQGHSGQAETEGMGSTLVIAVFHDGVLTVGHIGDSRCYLYREGTLRTVTKDHSAVQFMVDAGVLTPEQARNHPESSVLTRALGQHPEVELDFAEPIAVADKDMFLICSDGLHGYVQQRAIEEATAGVGDPQAAADALIELSLAAGGHDNVSIMVLRVNAAPGTIAAPFPAATVPAATVPFAPYQAVARPAEDSDPPPKRSPWLVGAVAGVVVLVAAGGLGYYFRNGSTPSRTQTIARTEPPHSPAPAPAVPAPPAAAAVSPPTAPVPTGPPAVKVRVVIIFPSESDKKQTEKVVAIENKLAADGFVASHNKKIVRDGLVWRMVLPRNAVTAPAEPLVSAAYLPGYREDATRICQLANCTAGAPVPVEDRDLSMFKENFPRRGVALFVHSGKAVKGSRSDAR